MIRISQPGGMHLLVCVDGNFEHRRCKGAGKGDQPLPESQTFFVPEAAVADMRVAVEYQRGLKTSDASSSSDDAVLPGLQLPNHVFDGCGERFIAADESKKKAESSLYSDTGLMALTCRHDRVIFMVNLQDAGEKQYNALALIQALFDELPPKWKVGILYDIGCQLHKSIRKASASPLCCILVWILLIYLTA